MAPRIVKTAEQRAEEMEALHAQLDAQVDTLRTSEGWTAYLAAARTFTRYSVNNLLLIMMQAPEATQVAGYRAWQDKGRQVRKGEKAISILGSRVMIARAKEAAGKDAGKGEAAGKGSGKDAEKGKGAMRRVFFPVRVFDISQTDAIEGVGQMTQAVPDLDAADEVNLYERVAAHFGRESIALHRAVIPGGAAGFCRKVPTAANPTAPESAWVVEVYVDERQSGADAALTITHEAAHIAAGHLEASTGDYVAHRGHREIEAEAAAFIVAGLAGLDASAASTGYVAHWMQNAKEADLKATAATTLATARTLAIALGLIQDESAHSQEQDATEHAIAA